MPSYQAFTLERAFDEYEFKPGVLQLSCSDGEPLKMAELLEVADSECRQLWEGLSLGYTQVNGHPLLISELAKEGLPTGAAGCQVVPVVPQEGILLAMMALRDQIESEKISKDFEAIVTWPSYQSLHETLRAQGVKLKQWNLRVSSNNQWLFDVNELKTLVGPETRLLVVNFPHNPSGFVPDSSSWREIIRVCETRGLYLFSDEIYNACFRQPQPPGQQLAVEPAAKLYDRAISMSGLSKSFGLAGLRLGWLATRNSGLIARCRLLKDYTTICVPGPVEVLGLMALRSSRELVQRVRSIVEENTQASRKFFARYDQLFVWREPEAGTTALVEMRGPLLDKFSGSGEKFCRFLVERYDIFVVSAALLQFSDRYFRVGLGRRDFRRVLTRFEKALSELMD